VPELPEVEAVRRQLEPAFASRTIQSVDVRRPDLRVPFPRRFESRLAGQRVLALERRAKYLLATLSSGETLVMHLGMSGSFRVEAAPLVTPQARAIAGEVDAHDHVVFRMTPDAIITFNDPRRFGLMTLLTAPQLARHPVLSRLGPEPLAPEFDGAVLARACRGKRTSLKAALLDQRVVAGLGNIYASEALHAARLSPFRRASTLATRSGAPRPAARWLADAIKQVLARAIDRESSERYRSSRFRVYDRAGARCPRSGCSGVIRRRTQNGRTTFYCPICQR
jgi:formamidopyrimidine-DNA glycosylase